KKPTLPRTQLARRGRHAGRTRIRGWPQLASLFASPVRMMLELYASSTVDRKPPKPEVVFLHPLAGVYRAIEVRAAPVGRPNQRRLVVFFCSNSCSSAEASAGISGHRLRIRTGLFTIG